jgi:D-alanine-D-alanine ligase
MKKNIALVTGGLSSEAEISYKSVITVEQNIDTEKFNVYKIDITQEGWYYINNLSERNLVNKSNFTITNNNSIISFDAVLMCIHGTPGEDGILQGYFDLLNLPYTTCSAASSALTFNKRYSVAVAAFSGIHVAKSVHLFKQDEIHIKQILSEISLPVFVKPNNGGSSIGMSKVNDEKDLKAAIEKAFKEDNQILIEEFIEGREFTIGVYKSKGEIIALPITEIISKKDFFDYEAKYLGFSEEITPAEINESIYHEIKNTAIKIYQIFNCNGVVRIDFIYNEKISKPFMLEINTVPGQSAASLIPQQVKSAGMDLKDFYTLLIQECL